MTPPRISRRALLGTSGAIGAGALLGVPTLSRFAGAQTDGVLQTGPGTTMINPFSAPDINFQMQFALGASGQGTAEYGEVATVLDRIDSAGATYDSVYDEFVAMSRLVREKAEASEEARHRVSARQQYLRAARYLTPPLFFVLATSEPTHERQATTYREMTDLWERAGKLFRPSIEPVRIPYEKSSMPGWFVSPPGADGSPRPTIILNNGNDAQAIDIYAYGGLAATERGWNALIFDGPGQGGMIFLRDIPFRPDWNEVVTPVVDFVLDRSDVDTDKVGIIGWSQGGILVAQAMTKEHRLAAAVFDPGVHDMLAAFAGIPQEFIEMVDRGEKEAINQEWDAVFPTLPVSTQAQYTKSTYPFGQDNFYDTIKAIQQYTLTPEQIRTIDTPSLVVGYEDESAFPGQAEVVYDELKVKPKRLHHFTAAEGSQFHDAPMAPQVRNEAVFDFFEDILG